MPEVAIIIPALNAGAHAAALGRALQRQTLRPAAVIVVDSSSTDGSPAVWQAFGFTVVPLARADFDHGGARNLGARQADGAEVLVFMTQDALPQDETWLEQLVAPILSGAVVGSYARQLARDDAPLTERYAREYNYPARERIKSLADEAGLGIKTYFFSNVCAAVRARDFWAAGGFPEGVILNEDMVMAARLLRAGHALAYAADARVWHSHAYSLCQQLRRNFDIGASMTDIPELRGLAASGEGWRFVRGLLGHLILHRPTALPYALLESAAKLTGHLLGRRHTRLPLAWKRRLSMHAYHWRPADGPVPRSR